MGREYWSLMGWSFLCWEKSCVISYTRKIFQKKTHFFPGGNYMFKVNKETLEQGVKYVQS